jgi:threonylcarbamoyladenosine tRNA methylthiotransferase MtaB
VADIRRQLEEMLAEGFKEIVLTGINIGQYEDQGTDLAGLLEALIAVPGDFRLRLTSLDPLEVSDRLIEVMAASGGKIAPHVHLSAQSAEDYVLRRMARRHHVAEFEHVCHTIARLLPEASLGSDIIVGFPGESDERFEATYRVLEAVPMNYFHVFSYSRRRGTPAATFEDQVPERVKKARANRLIALSEAKHFAFRQRFLGRALSVVVEESLEKGMSENYLKIHLDPNGHALTANDLVQVRVTAVEAEETWGQVEAILSPAVPTSMACGLA